MDDNTAEEPQPTKASTKPEPNKPIVQSYANLDKKCCYLCSRQFKTEAEVNKHERISDLHKTNLEKEDLKAQAIAKMKKAGIPILPQQQQDTPEYRDRAKERRQAFNTSKKISLPMKKQASDPSSTSAGSTNATSTEPVPVSSKSKGAALLGKMGWTSGQGLGAQGEGMTAPIATDMYVAGVGLGAEGGKVGDAVEEAGRSTRGSYSEFLEKTREKARGRFGEMK